MKLLEDTEEFKKYAGESVVTIGVFDGVHRGHRAIISKSVEEAKRRVVPSVVLTFDRNPREVICGDSPCVISPPPRKISIIESLGVDYTVVVSFDGRFASLTPAEFCREVLSRHLGALQVCVGEDFRFGAGGKGDVQVLEELGRELGFNVDVTPLLVTGNGKLSSTMIRELIGRGEVEEVMGCLGRTYTVIGKVVTGHSRGKRLGFPTANLSLDEDFCIPPDGVYAGKAILEGLKYRCAVNVGSNPTFGDKERAVEVFLLDFEGDIYGEHLEIEFHIHLRDEIEFESETDLIAQMERDVLKVKTVLSEP